MTTPTGHLTPSRIQRTQTARFNPLASLTPDRLVAQLDAFNAGYLSEAARTWDAMLRRDDRLPALVHKRTSSIARYGYDIIEVDTGNDPALKAQAKAHAEKIATFLDNLTVTDALDENRRGSFSLLIRQMASAIGMRYSVHEIIWQPITDGLTATLRHLPLWYFENRTGRLRFLPEDNTLDGIDMPDNEWLVTVGAGLMEASSVCWMYKRLPLRDWLTYCEKFGFPGLLGKTNATLNSPEWAAMETAVLAFANDFAAVCNQSETIETIEVKNSGATPFEPLIERMDRALAILWRGGDLSTSSGTGSDNTGASLQGEETSLLEQDDAAWLSEILQTNLIRQVIEYHYGTGTRPLAYVQIRTRDRKDTRLDLTIFETLARIGLPLAAAPLYERFGLTPPATTDTLLSPIVAGASSSQVPPPLANETAPSHTSPSSHPSHSPVTALAENLGIPSTWLAPADHILTQLETLLLNPDTDPAALETALLQLRDQLPELLGDHTTEDLADLFEAAMGTATLEGVRQTLRQTAKKAQ